MGVGGRGVRAWRWGMGPPATHLLLEGREQRLVVPLPLGALGRLALRRRRELLRGIKPRAGPRHRVGIALPLVDDLLELQQHVPCLLRHLGGRRGEEHRSEPGHDHAGVA
eukprot:scaffold159_cov60-Phaeocystis_antarctica.AAC.9